MKGILQMAKIFSTASFMSNSFVCTYMHQGGGKTVTSRAESPSSIIRRLARGSVYTDRFTFGHVFLHSESGSSAHSIRL